MNADSIGAFVADFVTGQQTPADESFVAGQRTCRFRQTLDHRGRQISISVDFRRGSSAQRALERMAERTPLWLPVPTPDAALVMQGLARGSPADWGLPWSAQERALMTGVLAEIEGQPLGPAAFELVAGEQGVLRPRLYVATSSPAATQRVLEAAARVHAARAESEIALRSCPLGDGLLVEVGPAQHLASTRCAWSGGETSEVLRYHIAPGRWRAALEARGPDWDLPRLGAFGDPNLTRLFADAKAWGEGGRIEWVAKVASERVDLLISVHSETDE